jgi:hypothetical protein
MNKQEEGFTITETLMAVSIVSLAGMIALALLSVSDKGIEKLKENLDFAIRLLNTDALMRLNIGMIVIPFWEENVTFIEDNSSIQIPWYKVKSRDYLRFFWDEHSLGMESGNEKEKKSWFLIENPKLEHISVSALINEEGLPYGLDIAYTYDKREYHTKASFGSWPVRRKRS